MRLVKRWLTLLALVLPAPAQAHAQAPTREALVGVWVHHAVTWKDTTGKEKLQTDTLTMYADSTWELYSYNAPAGRGVGALGCDGWDVAGDSLWFGPPVSRKQIHGRTLVSGQLPVKATLRGKQLTIEVPTAKGGAPKTYERVGTPPPRNPPILRC